MGLGWPLVMIGLAAARGAAVMKLTGNGARSWNWNPATASNSASC